MGKPMKLGTSMPEHLIGTDPGAFKSYCKASRPWLWYVTIGDHILAPISRRGRNGGLIWAAAAL